MIKTSLLSDASAQIQRLRQHTEDKHHNFYGYPQNFSEYMGGIVKHLDIASHTQGNKGVDAVDKSIRLDVLVAV